MVAVEAREEYIVEWYSKHKRQELAYYMDLVAAERHTETVCHRAENRSSYTAVVWSLTTRTLLDCWVLFPKAHNRPVLEFHNSDSMPPLLGVVLRMRYNSSE
jgi:L-arabinose isomerase